MRGFTKFAWVTKYKEEVVDRPYSVVVNECMKNAIFDCDKLKVKRLIDAGIPLDSYYIDSVSQTTRCIPIILSFFKQCVRYRGNSKEPQRSKQRAFLLWLIEQYNSIVTPEMCLDALRWVRPYNETVFFDVYEPLFTTMFKILEECGTRVKATGDLAFIFSNRSIFEYMFQWKDTVLDLLALQTYGLRYVRVQNLFTNGTLDLFHSYGFSGRQLLVIYYRDISKEMRSFSIIKSIFKYWSVEELIDGDTYFTHMETFGSSIHRFLYYQVSPIRNRRYARLFARSEDPIVFNGEQLPYVPAEVWAIILDYATSVDNILERREQLRQQEKDEQEKRESSLACIKEALCLLGQAGVTVDRNTMSQIYQIYNAAEAKK